MIFHQRHADDAKGGLLISDRLCATAHPCLNKSVFKELWQQFTFGTSVLTITECNDCIFTVGDAVPPLLDGYDYSIGIEPCGFGVRAKSEQDLIRGFMMLLDRLTADEDDGRCVARAEYTRIRGRADIGCRMVHFCVFPETELWELRRFLRFSAALCYTHVILEFWGSLRLECLSELSWSSAFSKDELGPILSEAQDLGLEIVPMFNHWGHASQSRIMHGKHVLLDQNPALAPYFTDDGWCWDIRKPKVRAQLGAIRDELCELCGDGGYFHVGCDEAYGFDFKKESMDILTDFLNEISTDMKKKGRRIIAWGDMLLYRHEHYSRTNTYTCNAPSAEAAQYMLDRLDKSILIADWQYEAKHAPVQTALVFKEAGFDTLLCPWDKGTEQLTACLNTARQEGLFGIIHTTWHTLSSGMPFVLLCARGAYNTEAPLTLLPAYQKTAALLRRVMSSGGDYERAGWSHKQVGFRW